MPSMMQATMNDAESALHLAARLLDQGRSVAILAPDVAPFAMLVNRYGDLLQTIETEAALGEAVAAFAALDAQGVDSDAVLIVVPDVAA